MAENGSIRAGEQRRRLRGERKAGRVRQAVDGAMKELQAARAQPPFDRPPLDTGRQELSARGPPALNSGDLVDPSLDGSLGIEVNSPTIDEANRAWRP
jgi:hypothetical protein